MLHRHGHTPRPAENAMRCQESENANLGEAKQSHPAFLEASIHFFCKILKINMSFGQCYEGSIFIALPCLSFSYHATNPGWLTPCSTVQKQ